MTLRFRGKALPDSGGLIMAIVNRTPDSFFDKGRTFDLNAALDRVDEVVAQGAHIVDIGGVKAAPGDEVPVLEEIRRVVPLLEQARDRHPDVVLSVDTYVPEVADAACAAGADIVNDAWGVRFTETAHVAARHGAGLICTHAGGQAPRSRPHRVAYDDVVEHVLTTLTRLADDALAAGVARESILIDPGHDFGKNSRHSLHVTAQTARLVLTGWPVLMALSRKDFVGEVLDLPPDERLEGTLAATAITAFLGARVFRCHDVVATRRVLHVVDALRGERDLAVGRRGLA